MMETNKSKIYEYYDKIYEGRVPPHSENIENSILGSMIIDNKNIDIILASLDPRENYFYSYANNVVFRSIVQLYNRKQPVDLVMLTEELKNMGELDNIGGPHYLSTLTDAFISFENIENYTNSLLSYWVKRQLIVLNHELEELSYEPSSEVDSLLNKAQTEILEITNKIQKKDFTKLNEEVNATMNIMEMIHEKRSQGIIFGVPSGYKDLDELTGGFQKSELIIVAGRPSHGKTAIALNFARNAAIQHTKKIAFFSIEMSNRELALRFICLESEVDISDLKTGRLSQDGWDKIAKNSTKLTSKNVNIFIDDSSPLSLLELRAKARRLKKIYDIDMIVVDYLQLMEVSSFKKY